MRNAFKKSDRIINDTKCEMQEKMPHQTDSAGQTKNYRLILFFDKGSTEEWHTVILNQEIYCREE